MTNIKCSSGACLLMALILFFGGYSYEVQGSKTHDPWSQSPRIVGGVETEKHEFPSMVSLCNPRSGGACKPFCAGTILSADWVLTAAHCFDGPSYRTTALAGLHRQSQKRDRNVQMRSVIQVKKHERYRNFLNDIALLKVSPPFQFNKQVKPAILPDAFYRATGTAWAVGWGVTEYNRESDELRKVDVPILDDRECKRLQPNDYAESKICATHPRGGKNTCQGDSGGPFFKINGREHTVVGITSTGPLPCADPRYPAFYTEVAYFVDWIERIMRGR